MAYYPLIHPKLVAAESLFLKSLLCGFLPSILTHPVKTKRAQGCAALQLWAGTAQPLGINIPDAGSIFSMCSPLKRGPVLSQEKVAVQFLCSS